MNQFGKLTLVIAFALSLQACKGKMPSSSTKDSVVPGSTVPAASRVQPMAITFVDTQKQLPVIMNVDFVYRATQIIIDYKVQRAEEQIMTVTLIRDDANCTESACRLYNDSEKISVTFDPAGKVLAMNWQGGDVDLSTVVSKPGTVDLKSVSCDMATGSGCFP